MPSTPSATATDADLLAAVVAACRRAGDSVMEVYSKPFAHERKADDSPLTQADLASDRILRAALQDLLPGMPVVSEESLPPPDSTSGCAAFWLVDPLDGTKEFIARNGEFTVNVALIRSGIPVLGVVHAPAMGVLWAAADGRAFVERGHRRRPIVVRAAPVGGLTALVSRSHADASLERELQRHAVRERIAVGSSLKLTLIAEGRADLYVRTGRTMEWDIAAGDAVLGAAGGSVRTMDGRPLAYGKAGWANPDLVARGAGA